MTEDWVLGGGDGEEGNKREKEKGRKLFFVEKTV